MHSMRSHDVSDETMAYTVFMMTRLLKQTPARSGGLIIETAVFTLFLLIPLLLLLLEVVVVLWLLSLLVVFLLLKLLLQKLLELQLMEDARLFSI